MRLLSEFEENHLGPLSSDIMEPGSEGDFLRGGGDGGGGVGGGRGVGEEGGELEAFDVWQ